MSEDNMNGLKLSEHEDDHRLFEITRIDDPHSDNLPNEVKICVYGENELQGSKTPHFHVVGADFEFEVYIQHIHNLIIWRTIRIDKRTNADPWNERADIRKAILEWLDKPNTELAPMTNAASILAQWNMNNPEHKIPRRLID